MVHRHHGLRPAVRDMLRDVHRSRTWRERLAYVFRGPGWAKQREAEG